MNYYGDPHDMAVMIATVRRTLDIVNRLRETHGIGDVLVPPALAARVNPSLSSPQPIPSSICFVECGSLKQRLMNHSTNSGYCSAQ